GGGGVDQEWEIALVDDRAVLEVDRLQVPAHPRAHLDRIDGIETRRVLVPLGDLPRDRLDDLDLRRWRRRGRPRTARREDERGGQGCPSCASDAAPNRHGGSSSSGVTVVTSGVSVSAAIDR